MKRLLVEYWQHNALHWARYVSGDQMGIRKHWAGLSDIDQLEAIEFAHWSRFAVNNNNCEEVAVYLRIAWALLAGREVLGNAFFYARDAASLLDQTGESVLWQFETDAEGPPGHVAIKGFTLARTGVPISPPPTADEASLRDRTLLFRIRTFGDLSSLLRSTLGDASGEISMFGSTPEHAAKVVSLLRQDQEPTLDTLLEPADVFVDLGVGVDFGTNDYILMASKSPLEPILAPILHEAEEAITAYEQRINVYADAEQFLRLLGTLSGT